MAHEVDLGFEAGDVRRTEDSEIIPKGGYLLETVRVTDMEPKEGKSRQWLLSVKVVDAEKVEHRAYLGAQFIDYLVFHENSRWRVTQFLDAVYGRVVTGRKIDLDAMIGKRFYGRVGLDEFDGKERSRIERFMTATKFRKSGETNSTSAEGKSAPAGDDEVSI